MDTQSQATLEIEKALQKMKSILDNDGVTKESLRKVSARLSELAMRKELWSSDMYPPPEGQTKQVRYLIRQEPDQTYALYLNAMLPGKKSTPHNHDSWACIASIQGTETNYLFDRLDDGTKPDFADVRLRETVQVTPGSSIALLPGEIHAIEVGGNEPVWQLHFYGLAVEAQTTRLAFDLEKKKSFSKTVGVETTRSST